MLNRTFRNFTNCLLTTTLAGICLFSSANAFADIKNSHDGLGSCSFSRQLENSANRAQFVSLLAQVVAGENSFAPQAANTPDGMYGSIVKANYSINNSAIDVISYKCLVCHDGVTAPAAEGNYRTARSNSEHTAKRTGSNHPIGMDYASYSHGNRQFKNSIMLDEKIILIDGKVGCLSCHNPLNPKKFHLSVQDHKSALCLSCHNK